MPSLKIGFILNSPSALSINKEGVYGIFRGGHYCLIQFKTTNGIDKENP